jgi:hypothetical protein
MGMDTWHGEDAGPMVSDNIIPFPRRHKGDPEPRRFALTAIGFRWREGAWVSNPCHETISNAAKVGLSPYVIYVDNRA